MDAANDVCMPRRCERCSNVYVQIQDMGMHRCARHDAVWDHRRRGWGCCGRSYSSRGCVPCDHYSAGDLHGVYDIRQFGDDFLYSGVDTSVLSQRPGCIRIETDDGAQYVLVTCSSMLPGKK